MDIGKKSFKDTKVGKFLHEKAPQILGVAENIPGPIGTVLGAVKNLITKSPDISQLDKEALLALIAYEEKELEAESKAIDSAATTVQAEIKGDSWMQRNWRPIFMLMFAFIVFNNYILVPYFMVPASVLDENVWLLIKIGFTGYGLERGAKKLGVNLSDFVRKKSS